MIDTKWSFKAKGWFHIDGRGDMASIPPIYDTSELYDPCDLTGQIVEIDGHDYWILGVETFAVPRSREHPYRMDFGLLVKERVRL